MSETTSMKKSALTLQRVLTMKSTLVGLLAVVALTGCGVGLDDPEGADAVTGKSAAAMISEKADKSTGSQGDFSQRPGMVPHTALPQDPIPLFDAKPMNGGTEPGNILDPRPLK